MTKHKELYLDSLKSSVILLRELIEDYPTHELRDTFIRQLETIRKRIDELNTEI